MVLELYSYCGDEHGGRRDLRVSKNVYKNQYHSVITWNIKKELKQVVTITYTLEKKFFAVINFEGL